MVCGIVLQKITSNGNVVSEGYYLNDQKMVIGSITMKVV